MTTRSTMCAPTFKFVVVGDTYSGKTTLIKRFLSDFQGDGSVEDGPERREYHVCNGHTVVLTTTVKHVRKDGSSVALKDGDIIRHLWQKKFSQAKSIPKKFLIKPEGYNEIMWDEIFVYLHKLPVTCRIKGYPDKPEVGPLNQYHAFGSQPLSPDNSAISYRFRRGKDGNIKTSPTKKTLNKYKSEATEIIVDIWDTCGDTASMWYRWYACTGADAVLLCVPLASILRFERMKGQQTWENFDEKDTIASTLRKFLTDQFLSDKTKSLDYRVPPVVLVGTQSDQCESVTNRRRSVFEENSDVDEIGLKLAAEIGCCDFVHCSGLRGNGVASVFEAALAVSLTAVRKYRASCDSQTSLESDLSDCESSMSGEMAFPTYFKVHTFPRNEKASDVFCEGPAFPNRSNQCVNTFECKRTPPQIFFPPPPESSPPLSQTNSSNSSFECSEIIQPSDSYTKLNSAHGQDLYAYTKSIVSEQAFLSDNTSPNSSRGRPAPVPRRRVITVPNVNKESNSPPPGIKTVISTQAQEDEDSTSPRRPLPKPRRIGRSPTTKRESNTERSRRESIFIKFLQAK